MPQDAMLSPDRSEVSRQGDRLDSWKEIGAYLKRDVTTVRRWEKREGLPVHRHTHERRDSVYAYVTEIDAWWEGRQHNLIANGADDGVPLSGGNGSSTASAVPTIPGYRPGSRMAWAVAATFFMTTLLCAGLLVVGNPLKGRSAEAQTRFAIFPPQETSFTSASVSPDGRHLAFTAVPTSSAAGKALLWVRPLDSLDARALPDTEDAAFPFWSPSGHAIGFFAGGKLWTAEINGGSPRAVADAPSGRGGTWNRAGMILFAPERDGAIFRVPATGGAVAPVTAVAQPDERAHVWPEFLPDGNHFLFLADTHGVDLEHHDLFVGALDGSAPRRLVNAASSGVYGSGHVFFARDRQLLAQPFDLSRLALTGEPVTIADRVQQQSEFDHKTDVSVSATGVLAYRTMQSPASRLVWHDRTRQLSALAGSPAEYVEPALSPDESRVAIALFDPRPSKRFGYGVVSVRSDIWILDRRTGTPSQFTFDPAADWGPVWSPDGRTIVFSSNRSGVLELYRMDATDAGSDVTLLPSTGRNPVAQSWSPDGQFVLYTAFDPTTRGDLWLLPMSGERAPRPLLRTAHSEQQGQISPDGRWLAYTSNESGREDVYVQGFPEPGVKQRISTAGGGDPRWRPDGKELFYVAHDRQLMAVEVKAGATFAHGPAVPLFDTSMPPHWFEARNLYDVTRDGRFLFMAPVEDDRSLPLTIVLNWTVRTNR